MAQLLSEFSSILHLLQSNQVAKYFKASSAALYMYEYFLTFPDELHFVWYSPWGIGKLLYFLVRYSAFADIFMELYYLVDGNLTREECSTTNSIGAYLNATGIVFSAAILALRTWALWDRNFVMGWSLSVLLVAGIALSYVFINETLTSVSYIQGAILSPSLPGCLAIGGQNRLWVPYSLILAYESMVFLLTLVITTRTTWCNLYSPFRHLFRTALSDRKQGGVSNLVYTLQTDGLIFYFYCCMASIINLLLNLRAPLAYASVFTSTQRAIHAISSSRIIVNLRKSAQERNQDSLP